MYCTYSTRFMLNTEHCYIALIGVFTVQRSDSLIKLHNRSILYGFSESEPFTSCFICWILFYKRHALFASIETKFCQLAPFCCTVVKHKRSMCWYVMTYVNILYLICIIRPYFNLTSLDH